MLKCRERWTIVTRQFCSQIHGDSFSSGKICSTANRERCMTMMQRSIKTINKTAEKNASVLIPIVIDADQSDTISLLYTLRSSNLRTHFRQVAFPGE